MVGETAADIADMQPAIGGPRPRCRPARKIPPGEDGRLPPGFGVPKPVDSEALTADEDPLEDETDQLSLIAGDLAADEDDGECADERADAPRDDAESAD